MTERPTPYESAPSRRAKLSYARFQTDRGDAFETHLWRAIGVANGKQRERLRTAFPQEVAVFEKHIYG